jgi:acetyl-CoA C-acetyltransferase
MHSRVLRQSATYRSKLHSRRSNTKKAIITSYIRLAIGTFLGSLREAPVEFLGATSNRDALERYNLGNDQVGEGMMGHAISSGETQNVARVSLLLAGLIEETPGFAICRMYASGIQAMAYAMQPRRNPRKMYAKGAGNV